MNGDVRWRNGHPRCDLGVCVPFEDDPPKGTLPFRDHDHWRWLTAYGKQIGLHVSVVAHPEAQHGYTFHPSTQRWHAIAHDRPRLIYDRRLARTVPRAYDRSRWLNPPLPHKGTVDQRLRCDADIRAVLPPTWSYQHVDDLQSVLAHHASIFIKPKIGSHGMGIWRIDRAQTPFSSRYIVRGTNGIDTVVHNTAAVHTLIYRSPALIQPMLPLHTANDRPADVRVLIQKKTASRWHITAMYARIGPPRAIVANLHQGGTAHRWEAFCWKHLHDPMITPTMTRAITTLAHRIADLIDAHFGPFVELGIDFGLSQKGDLWLIEVNSKPGMRGLRDTVDRTTIHQAYTAPLLVARQRLQRSLVP